MSNVIAFRSNAQAQITLAQEADPQVRVGMSPFGRPLKSRTLEGILQEADLNFEFGAAPSGLILPTGEVVPRPGRRYIYRKDRPEIGFGADCSDRFQPVQPADMVGTFLRLCEEGGFALDSLGSLDSGARFWATARTRLKGRIMGEDPLDVWLFMGTANDGTMSTHVKLLTHRIVCNNQLSAAISRPGYEGWNLKIPHSTRVDWEVVRRRLAEIPEHWDQFQEEAARLAARPVRGEKELFEFFLGLYRRSTTSEEGLRARMERLVQAFFAGPGADLVSARGTLWGAVNAVTFFEDHINGTLKRQRWSAERRFAERLLDSGESRKNEAFAEALRLCS